MSFPSTTSRRLKLRLFNATLISTVWASLWFPLRSWCLRSNMRHTRFPAYGERRTRWWLRSPSLPPRHGHEYPGPGYIQLCLSFGGPKLIFLFRRLLAGRQQSREVGIVGGGGWLRASRVALGSKFQFNLLCTISQTLARLESGEPLRQMKKINAVGNIGWGDRIRQPSDDMMPKVARCEVNVLDRSPPSPACRLSCDLSSHGDDFVSILRILRRSRIQRMHFWHCNSYSVLLPRPQSQLP